jgi:hypothetical protein
LDAEEPLQKLTSPVSTLDRLMTIVVVAIDDSPTMLAPIGVMGTQVACRGLFVALTSPRLNSSLDLLTTLADVVAEDSPVVSTT